MRYYSIDEDEDEDVIDNIMLLKFLEKQNVINQYL